MASLLEREYGLVLPRRLQIEFGRAVQAAADATGGEIAAKEIHAIFRREYFEQTAPYAYAAHHMTQGGSSDEPVHIDITLAHSQSMLKLQGCGKGPIDAFVNALGLDIAPMRAQGKRRGKFARA